MGRRLLVSALIAAAAALLIHFNRASELVVYHGGPVITLDASNRVVEALAARGDRIVAVGSAEDVMRDRGDARMVDLEGRALLPGFIDAHGHFPGSGIYAVLADLNSPPIGDVENVEQLVGKMRAQAEGADGDGWVLGMGYDDTLLAERRHPTRADLDRVSTEVPVAILHVSGHLASVNSRGLERLGIDASTPDPVGGVIRRDAAGEPDGVLEESAMEPVAMELVPPSALGGWKIFREATRRYLAAGVTTAQMGYAEERQMEALGLVARLGLLPLRLVMWPGDETAERMLEGSFSFESPDPERLRVGAVKLVADGSIQGYTGYLSEPYHVPPGDDPTYRGYPRIPRDALMEKVSRYHDAGHQLAVHGNGDASIDDILDAFEAAFQKTPRADARPIVIHAQMTRDDQLDRMKALGVIPSFFSLHTYYWGDRHRDIFMGPERAARMSPANSAIERSLRFTIHADAPVVPMEPLRLVWSAVNRRSTSGAPIGPWERITPLQALRAVTIDAAYQHFEDAEKGSLEVGKLADLVILDRSPLEDPGSIDEIRVLQTIVGGERVWQLEE